MELILSLKKRLNAFRKQNAEVSTQGLVVHYSLMIWDRIFSLIGD